MVLFHIKTTLTELCVEFLGSTVYQDESVTLYLWHCWHAGLDHVAVAIPR